ncbi:MAG: hypothetical protein ABEJ99_05835 [Candidatus Nanohaloarchaea archaeon]
MASTDQVMFRVVLPVMMIGVVLATLGTIRTKALNPQQKKLDSAIGNLKHKAVIGQTGIERVYDGMDGQHQIRDQFVGMTAFNMMAASDCRLLTDLYQISSSEKYISNYKEKDFKINGEMETIKVPASFDQRRKNLKALRSVDNDDWSHFKKGNPGWYSYFPGFQAYVRQTRGPMTCVSAGSAIFQIRRVKVEAEKKIYNTGQDLALVGGVTAAVSIVGTPLLGVAAGSAVASLTSGNNLCIDLYQDCTSNAFQNEPSQDMEGKYGRINFEINLSSDNIVPDYFFIGIDKNSRFLGYNARGLTESDIPDFWKAERSAVFMPPNLAPKKSNVNFYEMDRHPNPVLGQEDIHFDGGADKLSNKEKLYAFRPRIKTRTPQNIPMVVQGDPHFNDRDYDKGAGILPWMLEHSVYVMCDGVKGYIQSNAGSIDNNGEANSKDSWKEDNVYPEIVLDDHGKCIDRAVDHKQGQGHIFRKSYTVGGKTMTCTLQKALMKGSDRVIGQISNGGEKRDVTCGLIPYKFQDMPGSNSYSGKFGFYRLGMSYQCAEGSSERNLIDNYEQEKTFNYDSQNHVLQGTSGSHAHSALTVYDISGIGNWDYFNVTVDIPSNLPDGGKILMTRYPLSNNLDGNPGFGLDFGDKRTFMYDAGANGRDLKEGGKYTLSIKNVDSQKDMYIIKHNGDTYLTAIPRYTDGQGNFDQPPRIVGLYSMKNDITIDSVVVTGASMPGCG